MQRLFKNTQVTSNRDGPSGRYRRTQKTGVEADFSFTDYSMGMIFLKILTWGHLCIAFRVRRRRERKGEREISIGCLSNMPGLKRKPATSMCALDGNQTGNISSMGRHPNKGSHTSQDSWVTVSNDHVLRGQYTNTGIRWNAETIWLSIIIFHRSRRSTENWNHYPRFIG